MDRDEAIFVANEHAMKCADGFIQATEGTASQDEIKGCVIAAFLASLDASGFAVVPKEATEEMLIAAGATPEGVMPRGGIDYLRRMLPKYWSAMLAASRSEKAT